MSNQPPSDPQRPDNPQQPLGPPRSGEDAAPEPVSGQPWSSPSGDPLADSPPPPSVPYPTSPTPAAPPPATAGGPGEQNRPAQPGHRTFQPGKASLPQPDPQSYPPTSQFPQHPGSPAEDQGAAAGYGPPPGYAGSGYVPPDYAVPDYGPPDYGAPDYGPPDYGPPQGYAPPPGYAAAPPGQGGPPPGYGQGQPGYGPPPPPPRKSNAPLIAVILAVTVLLCGGAATAGVLVVNNVTDRAKEAIEPITNPTLPALPPEIPDLPTEIPDLPTDLPTLPTDIPGLPGNGKKITVVYEVTGDGPAEILYTEKLGETPKRVSNAKLPWRFTTTMEGTAFVAVTAFRSSTGTGEISCRATVDGEEVAQKTREGSYASATCSKMVLN